MADSLLQLLIAHGVLPGDIVGVEREAACEANRHALVHSDLPGRRPRNLRGEEDPGAFLEHDRHAEATVAFFLRWFGGRCLRSLPDEGIELTVYSRVDSAALPAARRRICQSPGAGRGGPALQFHLYNTTGSGISGFHYDPLLREAGGVRRAPLLRPRALRASRVVSVHDLDPFGTEARMDAEASARARQRRDEWEHGRVTGLDGEDPLGTEARLDAEATARARQRRDDWERGRATGVDGEDIDRAAGGPGRPLG